MNIMLVLLAKRALCIILEGMNSQHFLLSLLACSSLIFLCYFNFVAYIIFTIWHVFKGD